MLNQFYEEAQQQAQGITQQSPRTSSLTNTSSFASTITFSIASSSRSYAGESNLRDWPNCCA
eukprot:scaffold23520_cov202-Skeletonema_marinoi.AAC.4